MEWATRPTNTSVIDDPVLQMIGSPVERVLIFVPPGKYSDAINRSPVELAKKQMSRSRRPPRRIEICIHLNNRCNYGSELVRSTKIVIDCVTQSGDKQSTHLLKFGTTW